MRWFLACHPTTCRHRGSRTMELLAYMLTKPLEYVHWPQVFLHMQADNCTKEFKHQTSLRMFGTLVAQHRLRGAPFSYLQSGHSHEDIDGHFSVVSAIERGARNCGQSRTSKPCWTILPFGHTNPTKRLLFSTISGIGAMVWVVNKNIVFFDLYFSELIKI